jgi:hypothetical protein
MIKEILEGEAWKNACLTAFREKWNGFMVEL